MTPPNPADETPEALSEEMASLFLSLAINLRHHLTVRQISANDPDWSLCLKAQAAAKTLRASAPRPAPEGVTEEAVARATQRWIACRHERLGFTSGGFYIACQDCAANWVARGLGADTDIDHSRGGNGLTVADLRVPIPTAVLPAELVELAVHLEKVAANQTANKASSIQWRKDNPWSASGFDTYAELDASIANHTRWAHLVRQLAGAASDTEKG